MARIFSFGSWNVEHFRNDRERVSRCVRFIAGEADPDVFAIFEVEGRMVFYEFVRLMPDYNFFITEGVQDMETLIGVRSRLTAFVTQRHEFKSDVPSLRPGTLVSLLIDGTYYTLLFLHLKSSPEPLSWGLRDDMVGHVLGLKRALDAQAGAPGAANFLCLGDLNTMGLNVTYAPTDMSGDQELARYARRFAVRQMRLLDKDQPGTWWGGSQSSYAPANLDHVFASNHLDVRPRGGVGQGISVLGWPQQPDEAARNDWITGHSDHAFLYGEVHG